MQDICFVSFLYILRFCALKVFLMHLKLFLKCKLSSYMQANVCVLSLQKRDKYENTWTFVRIDMCSVV